MFPKSRILVLSAFAITGALLVGGASLAQTNLTGPETTTARLAKMKKFVDFRVNDVLDDLGATADQRRAIHDLKNRALKDAVRLKKQKAGVMKEVKSILGSDTPSSDRLHAIVDDQSELMTDLGHKMVDYVLELHDILDKDQRAQLARKAAQLKHRRGMHGLF